MHAPHDDNLSLSKTWERRSLNTLMVSLIGFVRGVGVCSHAVVVAGCRNTCKKSFVHLAGSDLMLLSFVYNVGVRLNRGEIQN